MQSLLASLTATLLVISPLGSIARADSLTIAVVAPQTGAFSVLGDQVRAGAGVAAKGLDISLVPIDENCEAGSGASIGEAIRDSGAIGAIGFLCSESLDGALPILAEKAIPAISLSVRWKGLMEDSLKEGWPFFRLAPTTTEESAKLSEVILRDWADKPVALIEDGTIRGRELSEAIRLSLEERGLKPVFIDTFRPGQEQQVALVRRLKSAGATHVFIGGDRNDAAIIARDAAAEGITLTLLGGDTLSAADQPVPLADGVLAVLPPESLPPTDQPGVAERFTADGVVMEGYALPAHAAVTILADAHGISSAMGLPLIDALVGTAFDTAIGTVTFGDDQELVDNPYRLGIWQGDRFETVSPNSQ